MLFLTLAKMYPNVLCMIYSTKKKYLSINILKLNAIVVLKLPVSNMKTISFKFKQSILAF